MAVKELTENGADFADTWLLQRITPFWGGVKIGTSLLSVTIGPSSLVYKIQWCLCIIFVSF